MNHERRAALMESTGLPEQDCETLFSECIKNLDRCKIELSSAIDINDPIVIRRALHSLKSLGSSFFIDDIKTAAAELCREYDQGKLSSASASALLESIISRLAHE